MNTKIYIDNESTICIIKNLVYHSKTKHIAIRHHFIRDAYEKKLIQVLKIYTDDNVADLLTKAFDVSRFQFLSWPLFKSKKIAQVVRSWIQSKNSLVKHFEDMRLCRPSKEYLPVWFDPPRDESMSCLTIKGMRNNGAMCASIPDTYIVHSLFGQTLISLTDDLSLLSNMAALESCPKHNMIAYLEKTEGNVEFHEVIDFLRRSYIYHALTVSPVVSTTFVEQFWTSAKSKTINNVRHITAKVAGKFVSISEASIRTDLIFDDADGIDSLPNQAIFDAIQLMGYEGDLTVLTFNKALFSPQWRLVQLNSDECFPQKTYLVEQPSPSPAPTVPDSIPEPTGENLWRSSSMMKSLSGNEDERLPKVYDLCIIFIFPKKSFSKKQRVHIKSVSKQGRKKAKGESEVHRDPLFDVMHEDKIDHMETENAQSEGRTRDMVDEEKEFDEERLSTDDEVSTDKEGVSTDFEKVSTDRPKVSTDESKVSTDEQVEGTEESNESSEEIFEGTEEQREGTEDKVSTDEQMESTEDQTNEEIASKASQTSTQTPTSMTFGDDETIATLLLNMSKAKAASKEKEKGVELKDVKEIDRPRPTSTRSLLTLKPLPKIDPKDKGKKKIEEEDESESKDDDIPQAVKKFKQLESDEELARKIQKDWEAEEERNKIAEEKATNEALIKNFDDIKARIEADRILAEKLQEQEREQFTIEERANKKFEDIQAMYEKIKRSDEDFIAIGSVEDDRLIKRMNKKDSSKGEEIKQESKVEVKEEDKGEESTRKRKHGTRKKMKSRKRRFKQDTSQDDPSDIEKENDELRLCLTIATDEDKEVDYEVLDKKYPIIDWKTENLGTKPQEDLDAIYKLVMDIYQDKIPEGFDKVLWEFMVYVSIQKNKMSFWNSQLNGEVVSWKLHSSLGVHTLMTDEGLVVHMLIEKKYPLKKEILMQMLKIKLESEE
ncbi:hypothetical protein Tco_0829767 [Tanacetum coccineum]